MRPRTLLISAFAAALSVSALACSTSTFPNDAPILDNVESPSVVTAENGTYRVPVTVYFHDNDGEVITHVRYRLQPTVDAVVEIARPNPTRESAEVVLAIPASACGDKDTHALEITVLDGRGAESHALPRFVTLR